MVFHGGISCVVHFICNEARPLFLFYIGWYGLLSNCAKFVAFETIKVGEGAARVGAGKTLQEYEYCILGDVKAAALSITSPFVGKCITLAWNPWGWLNFSCMFIIFAVIAVMTWHITKLAQNKGKPGKEHKPLSYQSARFVRYTTFIQNKKWYRHLVKAFVLYTAAAVSFVFYVGFTSASCLDFLKFQAQGFILTIWGAYQFTQLHKPAFAMKNDSFKAVQFKRGTMGLVNQSNDDLCKMLEKALYNAQFESYAELKALIDLEASLDGFKEEDAVEGKKNAKITAFLAALNPLAKMEEKIKEEQKKAAAAAGNGYQQAP